jgi:hypothetical protein
MNKEPEITIATDQEQEMAKNAPPVDLDRITRLYLRWREFADLCDSEIMRTEATPPTLIMSDDEKVRYEQASKTYRVCAESLSLSLCPLWGSSQTQIDTMNQEPQITVATDQEQEMAETARAILETSRPVLCGSEIEMLEKISSMSEPGWNEFTLTLEQARWFASLETQFAFVIGQWKNAR